MPDLIPREAIKHKILNRHEDGQILEYPLIIVNKIRLLKNIDNIVTPEELSPRLIKFFLDKMSDFNQYDAYCLNLDWFITIKSLYINDTSIKQTIMYTKFGYGNINYNYKLGFPVKLATIDKIFRNSNDFSSEYHKDVAKFVRISLPMNASEEIIQQVRKKKQHWSHKFIIYKTGSVTQSGPHPVLNEMAYNKFIEMILKNRDMLVK